MLLDPAQNHLAGAVVTVQAAHNPGGSQVQILPPLLRKALERALFASTRTITHLARIGADPVHPQA
ncbi:MAG: hypothetical protein M3P15_08310 [Actinomycetota bacterium]|nr:hypothetical protein [Actinomycetota bacterium]